MAILLPQPLSNDPGLIQYIYHYSHASKRLVEVYIQVDSDTKQPFISLTGPGSSRQFSVRASALGVGCHRFESLLRHTKGIKNGTSSYLAWCSAL